MLSKAQVIIAASAAAFSFLLANPAAADDRPSSVRESGPTPPTHHELAPTERAADARGRLGDAPGRTIFGFGRSTPESSSYEVQTPMSVDESGPFVTGHQNVPTMRAR